MENYDVCIKCGLDSQFVDASGECAECRGLYEVEEYYHDDDFNDDDVEVCPHCNMWTETILEDDYLVCEWCGECIDY